MPWISISSRQFSASSSILQFGGSSQMQPDGHGVCS
jgi:hypothetical protein